MTKCRWCKAEIHPDMGDECVSCWALRTRIEKQPEIAQAMLISHFQGVLNTDVGSNLRSCQETDIVESGGRGVCINALNALIVLKLFSLSRYCPVTVP